MQTPSIGYRGFLSGYFDKTAQGLTDRSAQMIDEDIAAYVPPSEKQKWSVSNTAGGGYRSPSAPPAEFPANQEAAPLGTEPSKAQHLLALLKGMAPTAGAAVAGAGLAGAGSMAFDALRGKKKGKKGGINARRAALLAMLGAGAGAAGWHFKDQIGAGARKLVGAPSKKQQWSAAQMNPPADTKAADDLASKKRPM